MVNGNRHYSIDTCCFVPMEVNTQFKVLVKTNGLPKGVYKKASSGKYCCDCATPEKTVYLGRYETPEDAFEVRKKFKQNEMKKLAKKYQDVLDERVIHKLENFDYNEDGVTITPELVKEI